jgi:hypothetical protein
MSDEELNKLIDDVGQRPEVMRLGDDFKNPFLKIQFWNDRLFLLYYNITSKFSS